MKINQKKKKNQGGEKYFVEHLSAEKGAGSAAPLYPRLGQRPQRSPHRRLPATVSSLEGQRGRRGGGRKAAAGMGRSAREARLSALSWRLCKSCEGATTAV